MESILSMISMWRGSSLDMTATGHFSSASGMTVWLVKASVCKPCLINEAGWSHEATIWLTAAAAQQLCLVRQAASPAGSLLQLPTHISMPGMHAALTGAGPQQSARGQAGRSWDCTDTESASIEAGPAAGQKQQGTWVVTDQAE